MPSTKVVGHRAVIRRPSPTQGRALEILGHAIEYLMDSYILFASQDGGPGDQKAIEILKRLSLEVFNECPEVVPFRIRLRNWLYYLLGISKSQKG